MNGVSKLTIKSQYAADAESSELFTLAGNGNVGIGTVSPLAGLHLESSNDNTKRSLRIAYDSTYYGEILQQGAGGLVINSMGGLLSVKSGGAGGMYIANGATTWTANSDERIKKNFQPIENAMDKLQELRGLTYLYKTDDNSAPRRVGVIAQDVQRVLPEAVTEQNGILGVKYTELIPLVIEAIKELKKENDSLKSSCLPRPSDGGNL